MVTPRAAGGADRVKAWLFRLGFLLAGALSLWMALVGIVPTIHAVTARAPMVAFRPYRMIGFGLALGFFALAAMMFLPARYARVGSGGRRPRGRRSRIDLPVALLTLAFVGMVVTLAISPVAQIVAQALVEGRGYRRCPQPADVDRFTPMRWVRSSGRCPDSGGASAEPSSL